MEKETAFCQVSLDDKSYEATELVRAVNRLKRNKPHMEICRQAANMHGKQIKTALSEIKPLSNSFLWLVSSAAKRDRAIKAYELLQDFIEGEYGKVIPAELNLVNVTDHVLAGESWSDFAKNPVSYYNILEETVPELIGTSDTKYGLPEELAREIQAECFFPEGLLCELRRYQEWGVKYILHQEKVLLGDEMGLGKTVQAIAAMVSLRNTGATHFMVVCPASVITNWCREVRKMSLLSVTKIHGAGRSAAIKSWIQNGGVAVTTYETTGFIKFAEDFRYSMLVVDEAHYVKNPSARRSENVKRLSEYADRLLFMMVFL